MSHAARSTYLEQNSHRLVHTRRNETNQVFLIPQTNQQRIVRVWPQTVRSSQDWSCSLLANPKSENRNACNSLHSGCRELPSSSRERRSALHDVFDLLDSQ